MKKAVVVLFLSVGAFLFLSLTYGENWGFWAHRRINRMAVFTLPPEMIAFYKKNIEYLTEHAVDPDKRRYATRHEAAQVFETTHISLRTHLLRLRTQFALSYRFRRSDRRGQQHSLWPLCLADRRDAAGI